MTEQIDNLLTPRVMVTNPWPGCEEYFAVGQVIFLDRLDDRPHIKAERYGVIDSKYRFATRTFYLSEALKYPHLFSLMHWSEGRELDQLPEYIMYADGEVIKVAQWKYPPQSKKAVAVDPTDEHFWSTSATPATSAQYLEYLNQQSK